MISLILLSAGLSSRFGAPKALAEWGNTVMIGHLQNVLLASQLDEIVVVTGAFAEDIKPFILKHKKIKVVYNKDYKLGQTSSFKAGLREVSPSAEAVGLLPVDMPLLKTETVDFLLEEFTRKPSLIQLPSYQSKKGHPPLFGISLRNEFLSLKDDAGINTVFPKYATETRLCEVADEGILKTFNTPEELALLRTIFFT
jgi:molybdenum cofactor cytidylyltransferase